MHMSLIEEANIEASAMESNANRWLILGGSEKQAENSDFPSFLRA